MTTRKTETVALRTVAVVLRSCSIEKILGRKQLELNGARRAAKETIATRNFFLRSLREQGRSADADRGQSGCDAKGRLAVLRRADRALAGHPQTQVPSQGKGRLLT